MAPRSRAVVVALAAILLPACGGGDGDTDGPAVSASPGEGLSVVAEDIDFGADAYRAPAGTVAFSYRNDGRLPHTLVVEGVRGFKLQVVGEGDVDRGSVDLAPGTYTVYCDIAGHRQAGMEATLTVA